MKVLLAMSGGLDSSMAAILLQKQGYEIIGATFRSWDYISESCLAKKTGCCSIDAIHEAGTFAQSLGFEHHILDFRKEFKDVVIQNFVSEYAAGRTPNPCVLCNSKIKWGLMLEKADELGCDYIATGHYAGIRKVNDSYVLVNATDWHKDQTYFLWQLTSGQLGRTLFPLYGYTKAQIKQMAHQEGFVQLSEKRESQEICFIPDNNYRNFIKNEFPEMFESIKEGNVLDAGGRVIGKHKGFLNYTIGQRKGLGIAMGEPAYVTQIDPQSNTIRLGQKTELLTDTLTVRDFILNKYSEIPKQFEAEVKIRYNTQRVHALIEHQENTLSVRFEKKVSAVTPGQSAVFYQGDECIGGGIIQL